MDKTCEATVLSTDKLKSTLLLFENTTDETELSNLCKELVTIINVGGEDERGIALSEAAQILIGEINAKTGTKILLSICKEIGKLDVIPLIAEIVTDPSSWWFDIAGINNSAIMTVSYCKDLIATAGSDKRLLKLVIDILIEFAPTTLEVFSNILAIVETCWEDEELVHWTLELYVHTVKNYDSCEDRDLMMECKLLTSLSVLLSVLFSKNPNSMDLDRELEDFPRGLSYSRPMCSLLVDAVSFTFELESEFKDFSEALKIMRVILPILNHVFDYIAQNYVTVIKLWSTEIFLESINDLLCSFVALTEENHSRSEKALKLFISSKLMERLLTLLDESTREKICCMGEPGSCGLSSGCLFFHVVQTFVILLGKNRTSGLSITEGTELLKLIKRVLDNVKIFRQDGQLADLTFGEACILIVGEICELGPEECRQYLVDPEGSVLPSIIQFATRHPSLLNTACKVIAPIVHVYGIEELFCHLVSFPSICLNHLVADKELIKRSAKVTLTQFLSLATLKKIDNIILFSTLYILKMMIKSVPLPQLQIIEDQHNVIDLIIEVLKMVKISEMGEVLLSILYDAIDKHQLGFLNSEKLLTILPVIWKKLKKSKTVEDVVVALTYKTFLLIPNLLELDYSDLMPIVLDDAIAIRRLKPQNPGLLRLIWQLSKHHQHKELFKTLVLLSADKTVEYASPGNNELARIFRLISDIIIEYLENDPPLNTKYLIDLTQCMVGIAGSSSLDEELYVLEDMVSPAIWALEKQNDERIVANVKEFIRILH